MDKSLKIIFVAALAPFLLNACAKEAPPPPQPVKKAQAQPQPAQAKADTTDKTAGVDSTLDVKRRNPFQSHIVILKGTEGPKKIRGPLECCELNQFRIIAVVISADGSYALVQAPDTKRYIVKHGDVMGAREGKVIGFDARGITVREYERDEAGKVVNTSDTELRLPAEKVQ